MSHHIEVDHAEFQHLPKTARLVVTNPACDGTIGLVRCKIKPILSFWGYCEGRIENTSVGWVQMWCCCSWNDFDSCLVAVGFVVTSPRCRQGKNAKNWPLHRQSSPGSLIDHPSADLLIGDQVFMEETTVFTPHGAQFGEYSWWEINGHFFCRMGLQQFAVVILRETTVNNKQLLPLNKSTSFTFLRYFPPLA